MKVLKDTIKDITYEFKELAKLRGVHFHKFFKFRAFHFDLDGDMDIGPEFTFENFKEIFYDFENVRGEIRMADGWILGKEIDKIAHFVDSKCPHCQTMSINQLIQDRYSILRDFRRQYIELNTETTYQHIPKLNDSSKFSWSGCLIHIEDWETNGLAFCIE